MARAGAFADCDAVLAWHPARENRSSLQSNLANITAKFRYRGTAAHAAGSPEKGRSALDAVALMTHAVDLLREHVPQATRLHYVITNGGDAPNVVPAFAEVYLYARHPSMETLDGIWARVLKCAEALRKSFPGGGGGSAKDILAVEEGVSPGSTDVGDVSWVAPTINFRTATFVPGTPGHSWQAVACSGHSIGRKGMVVAAKTLALTALDLLLQPAELAAARDSFEKRRKGKEYRSRLPAGQKPPLNYRDR